MKNLKALVIVVLIVVMLTGCAGGTDTVGDNSQKENDVAEKTEKEGGKEKVSLTLMINDVNDVSAEMIIEKVTAKFPDYDLVIKPWEGSTADQTIKTAFAADQSLDIVRYWPTYMSKFEGTGIPMDLTSYMEADSEWESRFVDGALDGCIYGGELTSVPTTTVYPLFMLNKDLFSQAGVDIPDEMSWDEFVSVCEQLKEASVFPLAINRDWACWFTRNGMMQIWEDEATLNDFNEGNIAFSDDRVITVLENTASLYTSDFVYPGGEAAVATTGDEALAQFVQGNVAIYPNVNVIASKVMKDIEGKFEVAVVSWPNMNAKGDMNYLLGATTGLFVMSNTKYPDEAVEVLKYLTSVEIEQIRADNGSILPKTGVSSSDPNFELYGVDSSKVYPSEIINLSQELFDYLVYNTPSSYIYNGETSIEELDDLREKALAEK